MHSHPYPDDPSTPPAYCDVHIPMDEPTYECEGNHACVRCEEEHSERRTLVDWFEHIATCKGC